MNDAHDEAERKEFEKFVTDRFEPGEYAFSRASMGEYFNAVRSNTFGGRVTPDYAATSMLWATWRAARALSASEAKPCPACNGTGADPLGNPCVPGRACVDGGKEGEA